MIDFYPHRIKGLILGVSIVLILIAGAIVGIVELSTGRVTPMLGIWTSMVTLGVPLALFVLYRLYGLLSARYSLDRNGFYLRWGFNSEQMPISSILGIISGANKSEAFPRGWDYGLLGWWIGRRNIAGLGMVDFFATGGPSNMLLLRLNDRHIAISPSDSEKFQEAVDEAMRLGALKAVSESSQRPDFFSARLWKDRFARWLILLSLALVLLLLGFIAFRLPDLPDMVPFGFDPSGNPNSLVPSARLLLLPLVAFFFWFMDLFLGAWFYRGKQGRPIAFLIWSTALLIGALFWGAVLQLIQAI